MSPLQVGFCSAADLTHVASRFPLVQDLDVALLHAPGDAAAIAAQLARLPLRCLTLRVATDAVLCVLPRNLRALSLREARGAVSDAGLAATFPALSALTSLDLRRCYVITNVSLEAIPTTVCALRLQLCREVTDAHLTALSRLTQLTRLQIMDCRQIGDEGMEAIARHCPGIVDMEVRREAIAVHTAHCTFSYDTYTIRLGVRTYAYKKRLVCYVWVYRFTTSQSALLAWRRWGLWRRACSG